MADDRFRRQLDQALAQWVSQGLIEDRHRDRLRQFYELDQLNSRSGGRFVGILMTTGAILVGLGIITFIAANWAAIPRSVRALTALGLMTGLQTLGFFLWRDPQRIPGLQWQHPQRLGSALILIGGLALGATIALMAQWVQIGGSPGGLFLSWSLGVLGMAYGIRHTPSGFLGIILWLTGFWTELGSGVSSPGDLMFPYTLGHFPLATLVLIMPLAYWCRSRWIFVAGLISLITALGWLAPGLWMGGFPELVLALPILTCVGIWAWSFWHDRWLPWLLLRLKLVDETEDRAELQAGLDLAPIAQFFSLIGLAGLLYILGFSWGDFDLDWNWNRFLNTIDLDLEVAWSSLLTFVSFAVGIIWICISNWNFQRAVPKAFSSEMIWLDRTFGICCLGLLGLVFSYRILDGGLWLKFVRLIGTNIALFGLGSMITWQGLQQAQRWRFWLGLLTLTLLVLSRFFEYPTGLLLKSAVLISCGVGVIMAGLRFERIHQRVHSRSLNSQP